MNQKSVQNKWMGEPEGKARTIDKQRTAQHLKINFVKNKLLSYLPPKNKWMVLFHALMRIKIYISCTYEYYSASPIVKSFLCETFHQLLLSRKFPSLYLIVSLRAGNRSCRVNERESFRATSSTYTYLSYRFVLRRTRLSGYKTAFRCSPLLNAKICANSLMVYEIVWPHCNYALKYLHHVPMGILDSGLLVRRSWLLIAVLINNNK